MDVEDVVDIGDDGDDVNGDDNEQTAPRTDANKLYSFRKIGIEQLLIQDA